MRYYKKIKDIEGGNMLFCYHGKQYEMRRHIYLNDYQISYATLSSYYYDKKLTPNTPSAIDKNKFIAIKKMHQEYLERTRIGHNHTDKKCNTLNIIDGSIHIRNRKDLCYGYSPVFGYLDTTGTASGLVSSHIVNKAINELIEKNEMLLLWYLGKGYQLNIDNSVYNLLNQIGFYSDQVYIFMSNYITNLYTFTVVLFRDHELMATGISLNEDENIGLMNALAEAKLLESVNLDNKINPYKELFNHEEYNAIYKQINQFAYDFQKINLQQLSKKKRLISLWVKNLEIAVLNINPNQEFSTIRCCSMDLINAIPMKEYLFGSGKTILVEHGIDDIDIENNLPNIFI